MKLPVSPKSTGANSSAVTRISGPDIQNTYGRHLPQRVFVLSTIMPISGSLTASQTLVTASMMPVIDSDRPSTSVKYMFSAVLMMP